jgi:hypothetical protein
MLINSVEPLMQRRTSTFIAAVAAFAALVPLLDTPAEARRRGAGIVAGVAVGIAAAAIIANSNRAYANDRVYRRSNWRARCDRWLRQCDRGNDYSCERFETRC